MAYRIFISHGWADRWVAEQISRRLIEAGSDVFIDVYDIKKGDDFEERIFSELEACQELVVLLTPWSAERNWVWVEIGAARMTRKRVVAVLYHVTLDIIEAEKGGTTFLRSKNAVDINELDTYFREVRERVEIHDGD